MYRRNLIRALVALAAVLSCLTDVARADSGRSVEELTEFLARKRTTTDEQRREVLGLIKAEVPDAQGRFITPKRDPNEKLPDKDLDWAAALAALPASTPGLDEVKADVGAIRELAATNDFAAAKAILDFAFTDIGIVYRDECGRYLRKMSPYSVPTLIRAMHLSKRADYVRYARYQLERLDREEPGKALANAPTDEVRIEILKAYEDTKDRASVLAVLRSVDNVSPKVREQARKTWMSFVTGPAPKPAPKRKLQLPGGKLTDEPMPLWLTYRELADIELRRVYEAELGKKPPRRTKLKDMSQQLFDHYDARRAQARADDFAAAASLAAEGKHAEAAAIFDTVLAADPLFPDRAAMAPTYIERARELGKAKRWADAAILFGKAHAVDIEGPQAKTALAGQHYAQGRAMQAAGKDGRAEFEAALAIDPTHEGAEAALAGKDDPETPPAAATAEAKRPSWMLYAGIGGGAFALVLLVIAVRRR